MKKIDPYRFMKLGQDFLRRALAPLVCALILAGCQAELYSNLQARQANEMAVVLEQNGIAATRSRDAEGTYTLLIDRDQFAQAVSILFENGLPRENFAGIGEAFKDDKLVSTAFAERVRYIHALEQELSESLARIGGVTSARVHITLPEKQVLEEKPEPSRAAVFVYHAKDADLAAKMPVIKNLIVSSVESLNYEDVTVALFPAAAGGTAAMAGPAAALAANVGPVLPVAIIGGLIILVILFQAGKRQKTRKIARHKA